MVFDKMQHHYCYQYTNGVSHYNKTRKNKYKKQNQTVLIFRFCDCPHRKFKSIYKLLKLKPLVTRLTSKISKISFFFSITFYYEKTQFQHCVSKEFPLGLRQSLDHGKKSKIWYASQICMSSLRRGHANFLCIVPILVCVLPKRAPKISQISTLQ